MVFGQDTKLYIVTHIDAEPNFTADAMKALQTFAADSRKDPGALSMQILEETARPNHFTVVEIWRDQKAYESHLALGHTRQFRAKLLPMLGSPFDERLHHLVP
jgi:quinol monooxygenase YgiN